MRDAEPEDMKELSLLDFARREYRPAYEAWRKAEKEVADAGGRGSVLSRLAGYSGPAKPRSSVILIEAAEAAAKAVWDAVLDGMKGPGFIVRGIPKGEHSYVDIADALLDRARLVSWAKGIIACSGGRRFEFVRVFQKAAAAGALQEPQRRMVRAKHTKRPVAEAIAASLRKYGFELDRKGKTDTELAHLVAPEFPDRSTAQGLDSLRQGIGRHFERVALENRPQNIVPIVRPRR